MEKIDYKKCSLHKTDNVYRDYVNKNNENKKYYYCLKCEEQKNIEKFIKYGNVKIKFGKHIDERLFDILAKDRKYVLWYIEKYQEKKGSIYTMFTYLMMNEDKYKNLFKYD